MSMTARVVMKGATLNRATMAPPSPPMSPQTLIPAAKPTGTAQAGASSPPSCFMIRVLMTAERAMRLPTERSIPAVMITMVIPMAMMAMTTMRSTIASRFDFLRKSGQVRV